MPIADYEARAQKAEQKLFQCPRIPHASKTLLRRFLTGYDVSSARRLIFLHKIRPLLEFFPHIESALKDRDGINTLFADLRRRYSPASYATYINVTRRFLYWMNDGERPQSMCDLRRRNGSMDTRRNLKPEDMLSWEDGNLIASAACNVQMAAIALTQLDCGFRPSEFVDLNYGDVQVSTGMAVLQVRHGKTGCRMVVAHRCVPALLKWLDVHPTKQAEDPLWIAEDSIQSTQAGRLDVKRYAYPAMSKRLREIGARAGIRKPLDFYNLRHSSCVLDKLDNLPADLAAERHGHSVKHFTGTYGRLSIQDVLRRFQAHYGCESMKVEKKIQHRNCLTCGNLNSQTADWCVQCGTPFTTADAMKIATSTGPKTFETEDRLREEVEMMRRELSASHERETAFRDQQLQLLRQMQDIQSALRMQPTVPTETKHS